MKENIVTKFQAFWNELNNREQQQLWGIFTALRGEDNGHPTLKAFTTSRIRGIFLPKNCSSPFYGFVYLTRKEAEEHNWGSSSQNLRKWFKAASFHWKEHTTVAMKRLMWLFPSKGKDFKKFIRWYDETL